jgi:hypothetical protein
MGRCRCPTALGIAVSRLVRQRANPAPGSNPGAVSGEIRDGREPQDRQGARPCGTPVILLRADEVIE